MHAIEVRDRIMIAHSLPDPYFGPAQRLHGATFVVDAAFFRENLSPHNTVIDIGAAQRVLSQTLETLAYRNLDEMTEFQGKITTAEFLCEYLFGRLAAAARSGAFGEDGNELVKIRITLHETDLVRAFYEAPLVR
jgi:6-pyruvoyl-tetrahydropterin synthase